jgi:Zinc carboxypeptidase
VTILLDERVPRTLDVLLRTWARPEHRGALLEAWLFEDEAERHRGEELLAGVGVEARLRSAYKPLVHAFLEEIDAAALRRAVIVYPVHPGADPRRFQLEAYPLAALLEAAEVRFEPGGPDLVYRVVTEDRHGGRKEQSVFAPNRLVANHLGATDLAPTGWLTVTRRPDGAPDVDEPLETEIEALFRKAVAAVTAHDWPAEEPHCERLSLDVTLAGIERPLAYGDEVMSTREALHEDLYFTVLEWFKHRAGRSVEDRRLQPGQIVPDVRAGTGEARVRVSISPFGAPIDPARPEQELSRAEHALSLAQIHREVALLPGERFEGRSREGRPIPGLYRPGPRPAVLVTAGQHANETSGVVGALRAAGELLRDPGAHLAVIPVENPDGYALHGRLCEDNPRHLHHAARYTALGSDLEYGPDEPPAEKGARLRALALSGACLHVNLHGYPAHEWTRPFTGYLPRGFELWTIPKGFFLIVRHHPAWAEQARELLERVTERVAAVPGLSDFNRRQIEVCAAHSGGAPYSVVRGIPCLIGPDARSPVPLTLITEFPDETVLGPAFVFAHAVQAATVLAAEAAFADIMQASVQAS